MKVTKRKQTMMLKSFLLSQNGVFEVIFDIKKWPLDAQIVGKYLKKEIQDISVCGVLTASNEYGGFVGLKHLAGKQFILIEFSPHRCIESLLEYEDGKGWKRIKYRPLTGLWPELIN